MFKELKIQFLSHNSHISSVPVTTCGRGYTRGYTYCTVQVWSLTTAGVKEGQDNLERGSQGSEKSEY